jgi:hypothetical protein
MTELADRLSRELDSLREMRDEVRLQLHLGRVEARERFEKLEERWQHLEARMKVVARASREELAEIGEAVRLLLDEIRDGYAHVKKLL